MLQVLISRLELGLNPQLSLGVLLFFAYAFGGYIMECIVLTLEKRTVVINRGFVRHLPFCIIYGFGAFMGYALLSPFKNSLLLLFLFGAAAATVFELLTGLLQIHMFGDFWWDYTNKPFNYKGILCLESTLGWGVLAIVIVRYVHVGLVWLINKVPPRVAGILAVLLVVAYVLDFASSARVASAEKRHRQQSVGLEESVEESSKFGRSV